MAATSASRGWSVFTRRALTTGAVAAVGLIALAIPASAHTPNANADCDKKTNKPTVSVKAVGYDLEQGKPEGKPNSVKVIEVTKDGDKTLIEESFGVNLMGSDFKTYVLKDLDGRVEHKFKIIVTAFNDKDFEHEPFWSQIFSKDSKICDKTSTTTTTPPTEPSNPSSSAPATVPVTTTTPPVVGANASLASTGASIGLPLSIGALLLVGGGVLLLVMRKRGKA